LKGAFVRPLVVALLAALAMIPASAAAAQTPAAAAVRFEARVVDPTRAPLAGARIAVAPDGQGSGASTLTDERGVFVLWLVPGPYTLHVTAAGFLEHVQPLDAAALHASRDIVLPLAGLTEDVTVSAPAGGYQLTAIRSATRTPTALLDVPASVTVVTSELINDQMMTSVADVMRYVPGVTVHQGENNRDQVIMRGNSSSADFFIDGVRDDVQYYRDLYNLSRIEVLKGPNALTFGRGGAGGVVNRVEKEAVFHPFHEVTLQGGAFDHKRATADFAQPAGGRVAMRVNAMFEDSGSFRTRVGLRRYGVTPTVTFTPSSRTKVVASYQYLNDTRVADRGITSWHGRPVDVDPSTYYGNPDDSHVAAAVHVGAVTVEHRAGGLTIRNRASLANYDRSYQNYVPGAVSANQTQVALTAYNNATTRTNVFNQTDFTYVAATGRVRHTLLAGAEAGRQQTGNFRNTGYFNNTAATLSIPFGTTIETTPVTFRQSATDADNRVKINLAAVYAQDQIELSRHVQLLAGWRVDRFHLQYHNNRSGDTLVRPDTLVSPRAGVVVKPIAAVSVYGSYSVSYLPGSGDQFSSLTSLTQQVEPEKFSNYEAGVKWDARPGLAFTGAMYRLDRTNTRSIDPNDPTRIVQTGSQRTTGYELGANGRLTALWSVAGGYANQDAVVTSATAAAAAGAQVGQVPHHTFSLWNRYQLRPRVAAGVGVLYRSDMFVAVDNIVTLPGYVRADAALYVTLARQLRLQANVENLFDRRYYVNADSNTNISPGSPRTLRIGVTTTF
jgi:catecholate siderophore receptor